MASYSALYTESGPFIPPLENLSTRDAAFTVPADFVLEGAKGTKTKPQEVIEAAGAGDADHVANEVADLIFHAWVMLAAAGANPGRVFEALEQRFGTGGLVEKASRTPSAEDEQP